MVEAASYTSKRPTTPLSALYDDEESSVIDSVMDSLSPTHGKEQRGNQKTETVVDEEARDAAVSLLTKFLVAVNNKEYEEAQELALQVLVLEPGNLTILQYQPILEELQRLKITAEAEEEGDAGDEDEEESSEEDDDDDDDNSNEESDISNDSDSEEDEIPVQPAAGNSEPKMTTEERSQRLQQARLEFLKARGLKQPQQPQKRQQRDSKAASKDTSPDRKQRQSKLSASHKSSSSQRYAEGKSSSRSNSRTQRPSDAWGSARQEAKGGRSGGVGARWVPGAPELRGDEEL